MDSKSQKLIEDADDAYYATEYDKAIGLYKQFLNLYPDNKHAQNQLRKAEINKSTKNVKPKTVLTNIQELVENADDAYYAAEYDKATGLYKQVLGLDPDNTHAQEQIRKTELYRQKVKPDELPREVIQFYRRARSFIAVGDLYQARSLLIQAIELAEKAGVSFTDAQALLGEVQNSLRTETAHPEEITSGTVQYQVATETLSVREGPGPNYKVVGSINNGEIVDGIGISTDGIWIQIEQSDGLTGWCSSNFLIPSSPISRGFIEKDKTPRTDSDRPSGPDRLNYDRYAQAFAKIILNHETSAPLTIGIYGQWGQGKSFLMKKIKEALDESRKKLKPNPSFDSNTIWKSLSAKEIRDRRKRRRETVDFHIVEFNAWAYVGTDHLWAGLVTHLYREAEKYFGLELQVARFWQTVRKSLPKSIQIFVFYGVLGFCISLLLNFDQTKAGWEDAIFGLKAFFGTVLGGTALAGLPVLLTTLKEFIDNLFLTRSKNMQNLAARPDFRAQIGVMADIKSEISFIGKLLRKGKNGHPTRFILFIDDLDRCEHKKAVEVMQAIMLLLADEDSAPFVIFMGIDARVIVHAIEATYGEMLVKAGINGYEYLDKIVQIPFVIPGASPKDIKNYVDSMLWSDEEKKMIASKKAKPPAIEVATPAAEPSEDEEPSKQPEVANLRTTPLDEVSVSFTEVERMNINQCTDYLINNPRKIKRIVNIYRYARLILPPSEQDRKKAIHWILITEQWPLHVAWILEHIENDMQTNFELADKKMSDIYELAKDNIRSKEMEALLSIDADPDTFVKFIGKHDFTVQEILALLPITFNLNPAIRSEVSKQMLKASEIKPKKPASRKKKSSTAKAAA